MALDTMIQNMQGLASLAKTKQENKDLQERNKRNSEAADYLRTYYKSEQEGNPDFNALSEAVIRNGDMSQNVLNTVGIQQKRQGQDAASFIVQNAGNVDNPDLFIPALQNRINYLKSQGRDSRDSETLLNHYQQDPVAAKKDLQLVGAALVNKGHLDKDVYSQTFGIQPPITPVQQAGLDIEKDKNAIAREGLAIDRLKVGAKQAPKPLDNTDVRQIQQDVSGLIKDPVAVYRAAKSLEGLQSRGSPLSQVASVFAFMKALDPTSAVRETEQGQVYDAQGAASGIAAKLNKMLGEGGLTKEGFQDIVDTSKSLANSAIDSSNEQVSSYLEPYGDTIPEAFKNATKARVPKRFEGVKTVVTNKATQNQNLPQKNSNGWTLHVDANGNKAYVSPDGKQYQEVK